MIRGYFYSMLSKPAIPLRVSYLGNTLRCDQARTYSSVMVVVLIFSLTALKALRRARGYLETHSSKPIHTISLGRKHGNITWWRKFR
jgi:hypothetical protein